MKFCVQNTHKNTYVHIYFDLTVEDTVETFNFQQNFQKSFINLKLLQNGNKKSFGNSVCEQMYILKFLNIIKYINKLVLSWS